MSIDSNTPQPESMGDAPAGAVNIVPAEAAAPAEPFVDAPATPELEIDHSEEEPVALGPVHVPNFQQTSEFSSRNMGSNWKRQDEIAVLPGASTTNTRQAIAGLPQAKIGGSAAAEEWMRGVNAGMENTPYSAGLEQTVDQEGSQWRQEVESPEGPIAGYVPKFVTKPGVKPTGDSARFQIRASLGLGSSFMAPLWHSGFWVTLRSPQEADLLELYRQVAQDKGTLGRQTYGYIFSNNTAYTTKAMMDFVMDHLYDHSIILDKDEDIRDFIRVPDLQLLIWGMACATYTSGFQYQRSCVADMEKCRHVIKEKLNPAKLLWTDMSKLTQTQIRHMLKKKRNSVTKEEVKRYVGEFVSGQSERIQINENLAVILDVPTVNEHIASGYKWVGTIEETYAGVLTEDPKARDDYLINQGRATAMRQYTHFVKAIISGEQTYSKEDKEGDVIEDGLSDLTGEDKIRDIFLDKVRDYINRSVVSLVAIPTFTCPNCGGHQTGETHHNYPELIPLDVQQVFFQTLVRRLVKIEAR